MKLRIFVILVTMSLFVITCNYTFEIGLEQMPTIQANTLIPSATNTAPSDAVSPTIQAATLIPSATNTATSIAVSPTVTASSTPVPTLEIPTASPSPTPLPGSVVIPVTSLGADIPWLPIDRTRWPLVFIVTINNQLPPFDNPLVRQAFAASIDRHVIVEMAKRWYAVDPSPATTFIPPQTLGRDLYGEVGINFDPIRARELMTQAGYADTSSFPKVTFIVNSYGETAPGARFNMASNMADMWLTYLGVKVEVQALKPPVFGERIRSDPPELFWNGWLPDPGNDPDFIRNIFHTDGEFNYGHFSNKAFDALVERAAASHDPATRQALYVQAEHLLCEIEAGIIPLYHTFMNIP